MNRLLFLLLLFNSVFVYGQEKQDSLSLKSTKQLFVGVNYSADYCDRIIKSLVNNSSSNFYMDFRDSTEGAKYGYTSGADLYFLINHHFALESGILYSNKGYQTKKLIYFIFLSSPLPESAEIVYNYYYLDIPIKANYILGDKKVQMVAGIGITTNFFLKQTQTTFLSYSDGSTTKETKKIESSEFEKINISPSISIGMNYHINDKMFVRLESAFRYGILKVLENDFASTYLWNAGINVGYYYKLE